MPNRRNHLSHPGHAKENEKADAKVNELMRCGMSRDQAMVVAQLKSLCCRYNEIQESIDGEPILPNCKTSDYRTMSVYQLLAELHEKTCCVIGKLEDLAKAPCP